MTWEAAMMKSSPRSFRRYVFILANDNGVLEVSVFDLNTLAMNGENGDVGTTPSTGEAERVADTDDMNSGSANFHQSQRLLIGIDDSSFQLEIRGSAPRIQCARDGVLSRGSLKHSECVREWIIGLKGGNICKLA